MKSSRQRLHNCCRGLSCVILGVRPMFPFIDKSPTTLPNRALCCNHYKTGRREGKGREARGSRACCAEKPGRPPSPPSSPQPGEDGSGMLALTIWEEPLLQSRPLVSLPLWEMLPVGGSVSACFADFLTAEPICGQTRCDHRETRGEGSPHRTPESRGRPVVVVGLQEVRTRGKV